MEDVINDIMEYVKLKVNGFSYMDQAQIYEDLARRMTDLNADALKEEYLSSDDYLIDGV